MPADKAISSRSAACVRTVVLASSMVLAACGGGLVPVHNIQNAPIIAARGQAPNTQEVRDAIMRALVSRGWQVDREGPDGVVATMVTRGNSATVLVRYDSRAFSISYLDSSPGLKFNGASIHRRYNEWVEKLEKSIRKLLADVDHHPAQAAVPPPGAAASTPPPAAEAAPVQAAPGFEAPPPPPADAVPPPPPAAGAPDVAPHAAAAARGARTPKAAQSAAPQGSEAVSAPRSAGAPQPNSPPGTPQFEDAPAPPPPPAPAARK
jgi:hypothetical protein